MKHLYVPEFSVNKMADCDKGKSNITIYIFIFKDLNHLYSDYCIQLVAHIQ